MEIVVFDRLLCRAAVALALGVSGGAALEGRSLLAAQEESDAREILTEDREVCHRIGADPGTDRFSQCVVELNWVRSGERRRGAAKVAILP